MAGDRRGMARRQRLLQARGEVFRTYSTYGRGVEVMMGTYAMLDLMPKGRNEKEGIDWVRRHDRYE